MTDASAPSRKGRRPAEIDAVELEALSRKGATQAQAAAALGIGVRTLGKQMACRPELRAAWRAGKRVSVEIAGDALRDKASRGSVTAMKLIFRRNIGESMSPDAMMRQYGAASPKWAEKLKVPQGR